VINKIIGINFLKKRKYYLLFLIVAVVNTNAELLFENINFYDIENQNVDIGIERSSNLYSYKFNGNLYKKTSFGSFSLFQKYSGDASILNLNNRNDELFKFAYITPSYKDLCFISLTNLNLISDNLADQNNKFLRTNSNVGFSYQTSSNDNIRGIIGLEKYTHGNNNTYGYVYSLTSKVNSIQYEKNVFGFEGSLEKLSLNDNRSYEDINLKLSSISYFNINNTINFNILYLVNNKDLINPTNRLHFAYRFVFFSLLETE